MIFLRRVTGESMWPTYRNGQIVLVRYTLNYKIGDVVVAIMNRREVVKRIVYMDGNKVFLVGDNTQASTDSRTHGWILDRDIVGRVVGSRRRWYRKR